MTEPDLNHLQWLIESRSKNQKCAVALYELLNKYPSRWKKTEYSLAAQALVGVTFSLWRAAFLADKTGAKEKARKHAILFLETIIKDNAIAYTQDKNAKESIPLRGYEKSVMQRNLKSPYLYYGVGRFT